MFYYDFYKYAHPKVDFRISRHIGLGELDPNQINYTTFVKVQLEFESLFR